MNRAEIRIMVVSHENTMATRATKFRAIGLDAAKVLNNPQTPQPYNPRPRPAPQQPFPQHPAGSAPPPRTCFTCGQPGHVKRVCPKLAPPLGDIPSASFNGDSSSTKILTSDKAKESGSQGSTPYPAKTPIPSSKITFGALCTYCQRIGHVIEQCRKKKIAKG